jgi:RimJ/RimL family protein N-acetyltransferase
MMNSGSSLSADILSRELPIKPREFTLVGETIKVAPFELEVDSASFFEVTNGTPIKIGDLELPAYDAYESVWKYLQKGSFRSVKETREYLKGLQNSRDGLLLAIKLLKNDNLVGIYFLSNNYPKSQKLELRLGVLSPIIQGFGILNEVELLIIEHLFKIGYRRIEFRINVLNMKSLMLHLKAGFTFEGVMKYHSVVRGCNRDFAMFRVLDCEWKTIKEYLQEKSRKIRMVNPKI